MEVWVQNYVPGGTLWIAALMAALPIIVFFVGLAGLRMKAHVAGAVTVALALLIAVAYFGMPARMAAMSAVYGFAYGRWPIAWIIVTAVFLYRVVVKTVEGEVLAKQLKRQTAKTVELASLNPEHPDRVLNLGEIAFMARVIWASQ